MSCEKEITLDDLGFTKKLVLNSFNEADSVLTLNVSSSVSTLNFPDTDVLDGKVKVLILKDNQIVYNNTVALGNGRLSVPIICFPSKIYEIQLEMDDFATIKAIDSVPNDPPNINIDTVMKVNNSYKLSVNMTDVKDDNKYLLQLYTEGLEWNGADSALKTKPLKFSSNDKIFLSNILTVNTSNSFALFEDILFRNDRINFTLTIPEDSLNASDYIANNLKLKVSCISKITYDYYISVLENTHVYGGPLSSLSRGNGNVEQGLGIFGFQNSAIKESKVPR
ncbi:DUF4249 domain-containing protein [Bacteroidia bacterium]|nr:DUF4249 domain-containing protein [Bacteroidia bacterium]